jgi:hypothetical protein
LAVCPAGKQQPASAALVAAPPGVAAEAVAEAADARPPEPALAAGVAVAVTPAAVVAEPQV